MESIKDIKKLPKFIKIIDFLKKTEINTTHFVIAALISLAAAFFEMVSVGALVPLVKGVITMDFKFVMDLPIFKNIIAKSPWPFIFSNVNLFILLVGIIFITAILKNVFQYFSIILVSRQLRRIANSMRKMVFGRYLIFGKLYFDRNNIGHLQSVLINSIRYTIEQLRLVSGLLSYCFMFIAYLFVMFIIDWRLSLFVICIFPFFNKASHRFIKRIKKASLDGSLSYEKLSNRIHNILSCMPLVKIYAREEEEYNNFSSLSGQIENIEYDMDKKIYLIPPVQEIVTLMAVLLVAAIMSFMVVKKRTGDIAGFLVFFYLLKMSSKTLSIINACWGSFATTVGPIKAIAGVLSDEEKFLIPEGKQEFLGLKEKIRFNHLNFSYLKERQVLKDINFSVEKRKMTAIVGPTGSGKTTLINLILRFYDCPPASIFMDGIDIRDFSFKSLMSHIALVSQDTLLFNDTFRNNITYGLENVSEDRLIDVIQKARIYDYIITLPQGLETYIGDKGVKLSGGEKQRVAIARALLKGCEILILDEATSSLDSRTERLIQEAIDEVVKDRTAIVIAHRLSTIKNSDKIVVIENGRFIEEGSLNELLDKRGTFYEYWQEQKFY
ncbi:MAG: ABC transporter ATP-binding protein/permease [Candidatus Omnitrophica bacterium]|jgi:subfamily B ATP-binding cassette protein MsbA|nr:ABC transporter ATP-binding protein/permease [Candidatus Omnitrophota bacterium]